MTTTTEPDVGLVDHREFEGPALAELFVHVRRAGRRRRPASPRSSSLADLRGIESHGANFRSPLPAGAWPGASSTRPRSWRWSAAGGARPRPLDADNGLGFVAARAAMELALERAADHARRRRDGGGTRTTFGMAGFLRPHGRRGGDDRPTATTDGPPHNRRLGHPPAGGVQQTPSPWAFPHHPRRRRSLVDTAVDGGEGEDPPGRRPGRDDPVRLGRGARRPAHHRPGRGPSKAPCFPSAARRARP